MHGSRMAGRPRKILHSRERHPLVSRLSSLVLLALSASAAPIAAQSISPGRWPATLHFAERDSALATFQISLERNRLMIDATTSTGNNWGMGNVRADSTRLRFTWALDGPQPMQCDLSRRSEAYWEGYCEDRVRGADGKFARILVTLKREVRSETRGVG